MTEGNLGIVDPRINFNRFFHQTDGRNWHQFDIFFTFRDFSLSAHGHFENYKRDLRIITERDGIPPKLQRRARYLLQHTKYDTFTEAFPALMLQAAQSRAEEGVQNLILQVAQGAGKVRTSLPTPDFSESKRPTKTKRKIQETSDGNNALISTDGSLNTNDMKSRITQKKSKIPRPRNPSISSKQSTIDEPWRSLLEQLHKKIKGGTAECSEEWPKSITRVHLNLFRFIEATISSPKTMSNRAAPSFVSLSGAPPTAPP